MLNKILKLQLLKSLLTFFLGLSLILAPVIKAIELEITSNGDSSDNEVHVTNETTIEVTQENNAEVVNNSDTAANTGENSASDNVNDEVDIVTGDVTSESVIENELNYSVSERNCCQEESNVIISGNGGNSENTIYVNVNNQINTSIEQTAKITNSIEGSANTGRNTANNNTQSDVSIDSGNINALGSISNQNNVASVSISSGSGSYVSAKVLENGENSVNKIEFEYNDNQEVKVKNILDIENYILWDANTGENEANGNTNGNVSIKTGDIDIAAIIQNIGNISNVEIECCNISDPGEDDDQDSDDETDDGENNTDNNDSNTSDSSSSSSSSSSSGTDTSNGGSVLGLSDTSSGYFQTLLFWLGLLSLTFGGKIIANEFENKLHVKKNSKI